MKSSSKKTKEYYGTCAVTKSHFKKVCGNNSWSVEDFVEEYSGDKAGKVKKFYYVLQSEEGVVKTKKNSILVELLSRFRINKDEFASLRTTEAKFYADKMGIRLDDLTNAICEGYLV